MFLQQDLEGLDIYNQIYHIECFTSGLTLNFKVNDHGHNNGIYLFVFPDINLVGINRKITFLSPSGDIN